MVNRAWGEEYRTTTVCVDEYADGVPVGRICNPYLDGGKSFRSLTQFLKQMERALNAMDFPKASLSVKNFGQMPEHDAGPPPTRPPSEGWPPFRSKSCSGRTQAGKGLWCGRREVWSIASAARWS